MRAASPSFSTAMEGDGMSGVPKPRSTTSTPARRASIFRLLMIVNTYGGRLVMRRNSMAETVLAGSPLVAVILREDGANEAAARWLHPRGDRDPAWKPQQVRDRPRHRAGVPRPAAVLGHRLPGRLRVPARHSGRGR